jgi:hypothetical protein
MSDMLSIEESVHATPQACLVDLTPPVFLGISTLLGLANGALRATWLAATDATLPIVYDVFIQAGTATGLFSDSNRALSTYGLTQDIFQLKDGTLLQAGTTYHVGVRARDGVGNVNTNTVSLSANSSGVITTDLASIANTLNAALSAAAGGIIGSVDDDEIVGSVDDEEIVGSVDDC